MTDVLSSSQRSYCMSRIRERDTKPEITLRKALWGLGYRYCLGSKLPGKPDVVFPRYHVALFIDGCFWHKCPIHFQMPKENQEFWDRKLSANVQRDKEVERMLNEEGWKVIRIWEHQVKQDLMGAIEQVVSTLRM